MHEHGARRARRRMGDAVLFRLKALEFIMEVDAVIKAIGQSRYVELIEQFGLEHDGGAVKIDQTTYQTSNKKVFACGDVIFGKGNGEAMVVQLHSKGKRVPIRSMDYCLVLYLINKES